MAFVRSEDGQDAGVGVSRGAARRYGSVEPVGAVLAAGSSMDAAGQ